MAIDRKHIGYEFPAFSVTVEPARLEMFALAVGEKNPRSGAATPTFMKVLEGEHDSSRAIITALGVNLKHVLHAEQQFSYHAPIRGGDRITVRRSVKDIYDKRGGALEFIVIESELNDDAGALVGTSRQLVLVRRPAAGSSS